MSDELYNALADIKAAWQTIQPYGRLWFFPVNNRIAQNDPVVREMMASVERVALTQEHVNKKVVPSPSGTP